MSVSVAWGPGGCLGESSPVRTVLSVQEVMATTAMSSAPARTLRNPGRFTPPKGERASKCARRAPNGLCKCSFTMDLVIAHGPIRPIAPLGASAFPVCV